MAKSKSRIRIIVFNLLWLGVVCGAAALAIARRDEEGAFSYLSIGLAVVMLVLFAIGNMPRRLQKKNLAELLGKLSVGLLILFAIFILATTLIKGYNNFGLLGSGVLILFLFTFIRIFISYMKDFDKPAGKDRGKAAGESEPDQDIEGGGE